MPLTTDRITRASGAIMAMDTALHNAKEAMERGDLRTASAQIEAMSEHFARARSSLYLAIREASQRRIVQTQEHAA